MNPVLQEILYWSPLAASLWMIFLVSVTTAHNTLSAILFKTIPSILAVLLVLPYLKG